MKIVTAAVAVARPYALLWFITLPVVTMAIWLQGDDVEWARVALLVFSLVCMDAGLSTWNDLADVRTDAASSELHRSERPLVTGQLSERWARFQILLLELIGMGLALAFYPILAIFFAPLIAYAWLYSGPREMKASSGWLEHLIAKMMWPFIYQLFWLVVWPGMFLVVSVALDAFPPTTWLYVAGNVFFMGFAEILNRSVNETLPRTVITGGTALGSLLAMAVLGGDVVRPFALIMLFGLVVGTFSSIFVASPVLLEIERRWPGPHARGLRTEGRKPAGAPARKTQPVA